MKKLAASLAVAGALVAQPAWAMESTTFAGDVDEAKPVVSVRVDDSDPDDGVCTGTAIDPHWVITARHCVEAAAKPGGSVRTGQETTSASTRWTATRLPRAATSPCSTPKRKCS